jgi:8-oxo-dGTP pyrophosphatase MutT (NUDIX family)
MQLRSQKAGIFYPGHWGLFGGAVDENEDPDSAMARELREELNVEFADQRYFAEFTFDFSFSGYGPGIPSLLLHAARGHEVARPAPRRRCCHEDVHGCRGPHAVACGALRRICNLAARGPIALKLPRP